MMKKVLATVSVIAMASVIAFATHLSDNAAEHLWPKAEVVARLPAPSVAAQPQQPTAAEHAPVAVIRLGSHSGIEDLGIITGGAKIGLLNENTDSAVVKNVRITGVQDVGIANINAKHPLVEDTTVVTTK